MPSTAPAPIPGALFQRHPPGPPRLEMLLRARNGDAFHFYAADLSFADLEPILAADLRPMQVLVYRMPPSLLNPEYWQPHTREAEGQIRDRLTGVITRQEDDSVRIWRADHVVPGRHLRPGLAVPVELHLGYAFQTTGAGLLELGRAWSESGERERFEWIAYRRLPQTVPREAVLAGHNDLASFRLSSPDERIAFASAGGGRTRLLVAERRTGRRLVRAALQGFFLRLSGKGIAQPNDAVCDQVIEFAAGEGLRCDPSADFLDKNTTYEARLHRGGTIWDAAEGRNGQTDEAVLLAYYDRSSGIWAVAH